MKILHLIYDDIGNPWLRGGGAYATYEINKRLAKNHKIVVATGNYPGASNKILDNIHFIRVGKGNNYLQSRINYSIGIKKIIKESEFDILIDDFSPFSPTFSYRYTKKPIIAVFRNIFQKEVFNKYSILGILPYYFEKYAFKNYNHFIVYSKSMLKKLKILAPNKDIKLLRRGMDISSFKPGKEHDYILFLGRIDIYQKGIDILLEAFSSIKTDIKLVIAGDGTHGQITRLKRLIERFNLQDRVILRGRVEGKEKVDLLSNCMFVVMPSRYESWGNVAIEAAASGKPVIGSDIDGLSDSVLDKKTGILVSVSNVKDLSKSIEHIINNNKLRCELAKNAITWASNFKIHNQTIKQEEIYKSLIGD